MRTLIQTFSNIQLGKRSQFAVVLLLTILVATIWLATNEIRTTAALISAVEKGLLADAQTFPSRLSAEIEQIVYDNNARLAVESATSYLLPDTTGRTDYTFNISHTYSVQNLVEYPFYIDFQDSLAYFGDGVKQTDELLTVLSFDTLSRQIPNLYDRSIRGYAEGPYGSFHYVYKYDMVGPENDIILKGVKINSEIVRDSILPVAYQNLKDNFYKERNYGLEDFFALEIQLSDTVIIFNAKSNIKSKTGRSEFGSSFNADGIFPNWKVNVYFYNWQKDEQLFRYALMVIPLFMVVFGLFVTFRMAIRNLELSRARSAFVSNVSHELKTPLAKIKFFNEMLASQRIKDVEKQARYFEIIEQECDRLTLLVDNVLDFSRIEQGTVVYTLELSSLQEIVTDVCNTLRLLYESRGYTLQVDVDETCPLLMLDDNAIRQALINLLDNAVKYSEPHNIQIAVFHKIRSKGTHVYLSVTDNGIGIPKNKLSQIFDKFFRVETSLSQRIAGSGLGLALVQHIAQAHEGKVEVTSTENIGSTFTIVFPYNNKIPAGQRITKTYSKDVV